LLYRYYRCARGCLYHYFLILLWILPPLRSTLFPYTTLFRSNFSVNFAVNGKKYIVVTASEGTQGIFRNRVVERVKKPGFLTKQIAVDLPIFLYLNQFFTKQ